MTRPEAETLDQVCREALHRFRLSAFDNVEVASLLNERVVPERAEWIARHLLKHGRGMEAYRAGQQILALLGAVNVA